MLIDLAITLVKIAIMIGGVLGLVYLLSWMERKQSAVMQDRIGANRAPILGLRMIGLFHPIADALKLLTKEDFVPAGAYKFFHSIAPFVSLFFALVAFAAIPFGPTITIGERVIDLQIVGFFNVGLLYLLAMMSLGMYGVILAGWASRNNYALMGGLRATSQMISYEVAMGSAIVGLIMVYQSLNLQEMVKAQGTMIWGIIPQWGVVLQPLGFLLFLTAGIAETKRIPFDLPEGESEIIGYFIEYSGMRWGLFLTTDFVETVLISGMVTSLFFGGWQVPFLMDNGFHFGTELIWTLSPLTVTVLRILSFAIKVFFFCWFLLLVRWTLPRFRYDQLLRLGWKVMMPLAFVNIVVTGLILVIFA
ncbi:MAG: NADH-quinone oxidoreductase subunit H [Candidatus Tectomicrobia bacterium]|nr:NADH-quinone oxidoreductase subunit H [Candidatus Tectomicrobia bacterium]